MGAKKDLNRASSNKRASQQKHSQVQYLTQELVLWSAKFLHGEKMQSNKVNRILHI